MAEGGAGGLRYYCYSCREDIQPEQTDEELKCPRCDSGFVEIMEAPAAASMPTEGGAESSASSSSSDDDPSILHHFVAAMSGQPMALGGDGSARTRPRAGSDSGRSHTGSGLPLSYERAAPGGVAQVSFANLGDMFAHGGPRVVTHTYGPGIVLQQASMPGDGHAGGLAGLINMILSGAGTTIPTAGGQMGDYVYGQGGLDAVITRLLDSMDGPRPTPVSEDSIGKLPRVTITQEHRDKDAACSVCFDEFELGACTIEVPCQHLFHPDCILPWIRQHNTCPVCRTVIGEIGASSSAESSAAGQPAAASSAAASSAAASSAAASSSAAVPLTSTAAAASTTANSRTESSETRTSAPAGQSQPDEPPVARSSGRASSSSSEARQTRSSAAATSSPTTTESYSERRIREGVHPTVAHMTSQQIQRGIPDEFRDDPAFVDAWTSAAERGGLATMPASMPSPMYPALHEGINALLSGSPAYTMMMGLAHDQYRARNSERTRANRRASRSTAASGSSERRRRDQDDGDQPNDDSLVD